MKRTHEPSFFSDIFSTIKHDIKKLKRKKAMLKLEAILLIILPVLIVLITVKVIQTYTRIKLRQIAVQQKTSRISKDSDNDQLRE